ncbi:MAG: adenine deaminase C-terminal domain-containing protein, partial [Bacillus sp. (in: firmicutes)]
SLNTAQCYNLKGKGAIAPGFDADFILLNDVEEFVIDSVWVNGTRYEEEAREKEEEVFENTVILGSYCKELLSLPLTSDTARVIEIIPNSIVTKKSQYKVPVEDGIFMANDEFAKMAVIERHKGTGSAGVGIVKGFNLQKGAIATTIAHDSHNIICIGTNDEDMDIAIRELEKIGGGISIACNGETIAALSLPFGGLMTTISPQQLNDEYSQLLVALSSLGITDEFSPLLTLSFLALPVIPSLKLTNQGLFDVDTFTFVDVSVND